MYLRTPSTGLNGYQGLGDAASVQAEITAAANQYGVPPALALAVAKQESGYQQFGPSGSPLTSSAGALGVMQLMPATAAGLNVNPADEQQNIDGGVRLLSQLLNQFNGNVSDALAAYNAGPSQVTKYGGVPPFPETQNYVSSILANYEASGGSPDLSASDYAASDSSTFDLSSYLPTSLADLLPQDPTQYDLGGVVLSGSDLLILGITLIAGFAISRIL